MLGVSKRWVSPLASRFCTVGTRWLATVIPPNSGTTTTTVPNNTAPSPARATHEATVPLSGPSIELYQYAICPFCNKVKAFLDYAGIAYQAIEVNPLTKFEIKW
jgi:Glutaredoxin